MDNPKGWAGQKAEAATCRPHAPRSGAVTPRGGHRTRPYLRSPPPDHTHKRLPTLSSSPSHGRARPIGCWRCQDAASTKAF
ncbi:hypothetical protein FOA52_004547 [Chlamydomonas sp. UWO 241]|nr:hypothetical protein FOA52_004547 [Chlamydomonas sp. UWO 241]